MRGTLSSFKINYSADNLYGEMITSTSQGDTRSCVGRRGCRRKMKMKLNLPGRG